MLIVAERIWLIANVMLLMLFFYNRKNVFI